MLTRRAFAFGGVAAGATALSACIDEAPYLPLSVPKRMSPRVPGIPNARFLTDAAGRPEWEREATDAWTRRTAYLKAMRRGAWTETALALSGGGQDGAFGAGLLVGWTKRGDRPEFDYVTGVSTGALLAPFAFLGPAYDERMRDLFTTVDEDALLRKRWFGAALTEDAVYDTAPLFEKIQTVVDPGMVADIAREYANGRLLLIGTTNIVAARPTIWNLGAIAGSRRPEAATLIHRVLLASAAIPTLFPPVPMDLEIDGQPFRELHVDGGATVGQFLYSPTLHLRELPRPQGATNRILAYVVRNGRLRPAPKAIKPSALDLAERAVSALTASQGLGDLYREFELAKRDRVDLRYTAIGDDFDAEPVGLFDRGYMNALFAYGYSTGMAGTEWVSTAPGFER